MDKALFHGEYPVKSQNSCFDRLLLYDFQAIINSPEEFTLSKDEITYYVTYKMQYLTHMTDFIITILFLNAHQYIPEIFSKLNDSKNTPKYNATLIADLIELQNGFFNFDIYHSIASTQPHMLPRLLAFQKTIFQPEFFPSNNQIYLRFPHSIIPLTESNIDITNLTFTYFFEFLKLSNPFNFPNKKHFYSSYYFDLLHVSLNSIPLQFLPTYHEIVLFCSETEPLTLYYSLDKNVATSLYFDRRQGLTKEACLQPIMSIPIMCALAFKNGHTDFLSMCDVHKTQLENPECFL